MNQKQEFQRGQGMQATWNDPWLSVSLLSESDYCKRAGIIQYERDEEDQGDEIGHLGRKKRHFYNYRQIMRERKRYLKRALIWFVFICISLFASVLPVTDLTVNCLKLVGFLFLGFCLGNLVRALNYWFLERRYKHFQASVPHPAHQEPQWINWWSMINAGFHFTRPQDQYRDEHWRLAGRPWAVLVHGDLRIPVFRRRIKSQSEMRLYHKNFVRMAAYCHLLEKGERGAKAPYGIVLMGDTEAGLSVPYQPGTKKMFHTALREARATLGHSQSWSPPPPTAQVCLNCPHSWRDRYTDESVCGNRFGWIPPNIRDTYEYY